MSELFVWLAGFLLVLWVGFNWSSPLALLGDAEELSLGRLPAELLARVRAHKVRFYLSALRRGPGFSAWVWPWSFVVFDRQFFRHASPELVRYLIAHELAHFALRHPQRRWLVVVTGVVLLPPVRRWLARCEDEADAFAEKLTGFRREFFDQLKT